MDTSRQPRTSIPPVAEILRQGRTAQRSWAEASIRQRLRVVERLRRRIVENARVLADCVEHPGRRSVAETLSAEVVPLADACRFLERSAARILRARRLGSAGRPVWLWGSAAEVRREPFGLVLVIGPSNYPLFLPAVQALQALVAGNAVVLKPGRGGRRVADLLAALLQDSGLDHRLLAVLDESVGSAVDAIASGVDKVVLTGSVETGRSVLAKLAPRVTPATVELSGCDAAFVLPGADLELVARAIAFGLTLNGGATCIAPRRLFVPHESAAELERRIAGHLDLRTPVALDLQVARRLRSSIDDALASGARIATGAPPENGRVVPTLLADVPPGAAILGEDLFAPVVSLVAVADPQEALDVASRCPYGLGATVFGPEAAARELARRVRAGTVVINDIIVPTADPRVPFGGRGDSGFGVTRGAEGLLEMTAIKTVVSRRGRFRPHLQQPSAEDAPLLEAWLRTAHATTWSDRLAGCLALIRAARRRTRDSVDDQGRPS